jgi:hypothetical protein
MANRRLFLLLHKIFHRRRTSPVFPVRELMTNVLGYSDGLTSGERNQKLRQVARRLDRAGVIKFAADDIERTGPGNFTVQFRRGKYFDDLQDARNQPGVGNSPLADALRSRGFESRDADRVCSRYKVSLLREWIDITIAYEERHGPNAFTRSRQAFLIDNLKHAAAGTHSAPDWWQEIRRREQRTDGTSRDRHLLKQLQAKLAEPADDVRARTSDPTSNAQRIGDILHSI